MPQLPKEISDLMTSDAYYNELNPKHSGTREKVDEYFENTYNEPKAIYVWHCENTPTTCSRCREMDGKIFHEESEFEGLLPVHPNCKCWIEKRVKDTIFARRISRTIKEEGGYEDRVNRIEKPTNMGINATSLGNYNKTHPNFNFPDNIKEVLPEQARQIYQEDYYGRRGIKDIENDRVAFAIMDMGVMSGFNEVVKTVQKTINQTLSDKVSVNGTYNEKIRRETLDALNNIPEDGVDAFMKKLIENRLDYLEKLDPDFLQNPGWRNRTRKYIESRQ